MADKVIEIKKVIGKVGNKQLTFATLKEQDKFDLRKDDTDKIGIRFTDNEIDALYSLNVPCSINSSVEESGTVEYKIHERLGTIGAYELCTMTWVNEDPTYNFTVIVNGRLVSRKLTTEEMNDLLQILTDARKLYPVGEKTLAECLMEYDDSNRDTKLEEHTENIVNITEKIKEKTTADIISEAKKAQAMANNVVPNENESFEFKFEFEPPTKEPDTTDGLGKFKEQMNKMVDDSKNKEMAKKQYGAIINYIENKYDDDYNKLMCQPNKSFDSMWKFISDKAKEKATGNCAMIEDDVVYGWADEYLSVDDYDKWAKEQENKAKAKAKAEELKKKATTKKTTSKKTTTKK